MRIYAEKIIGNVRNILGHLAQRRYSYTRLAQHIEKVVAEIFLGKHLHQCAVGGAYHPHIGMFLRENMQEHRLFLEVEKLDIFQDDRAAGSILEVALDAVIHLVTV